MANPGNVAGGLKATLKNPNVSEEAKKNAQDRLDNEDFSSPDTASTATEDGKNTGNVVGGLKAALKNPNTSEQKKAEIQERLDDAE